MDGPSVDVYVNGKVAVNGGMPQDNLVARQASGYLYLVPGTYSIAIVPTGMGIDKALFGPLDVPVVAGHRTSLPEVIGDAGLLIDPFDEHELTGALARLCADADLRARLRAKGLQRAARFSWRDNARQTLEVYQRATRRRDEG